MGNAHAARRLAAASDIDQSGLNSSLPKGQMKMAVTALRRSSCSGPWPDEAQTAPRPACRLSPGACSGTEQGPAALYAA